ncbi:MAG: hydroxyacid dehydrogenase [Proteobacteria bacterium]|nr:hydroxyacid dehydrogenase [Pseudomonadota bacterium]
MVTIFCEVEELEADTLLKLYGDLDYDVFKEPLNADNAKRCVDAEIISTFIYSDLSRKTLEQLRNLKFITTRSRSVDHIDLDYCAEKDIAVSNVPAYGEHTVAEHVFCLLLALNRQLPKVVQQTREGNFSLRGVTGFDLYGKTFGVIGTGAIGLRAIEIAHGFGMNVLGHDVQVRPDTAKKLGFGYVSLDELLARSDVVSLHVSTASGNRPVLGEREFSLMKEGATIINTSRGSAIDLKALLQALSKGKVRAAGLDVLPDEPAIRDDAEFLRESFSEHHDAATVLTSHALLRHKNVIVTPHSAFYTHETVESILRTTGENIEAYMAGQPQNVVRASSLLKWQFK